MHGPMKRSHDGEVGGSTKDVLELDPKGDLVLKIGIHPNRLIRVSTKHLTVTSPVFEALLSPNFREGQTIRDCSDPLLLPDDDPKDMETLLKILHHKHGQPSEIKPHDLVGLAVVGDKYDCMTALTSTFHLIITLWLETIEKDRTGMVSKRRNLLFQSQPARRLSDRLPLSKRSALQDYQHEGARLTRLVAISSQLRRIRASAYDAFYFHRYASSLDDIRCWFANGDR